MKISYDGQLIFTSLNVTFRSNTIRIDDVIIDTGASHTILSPDILEEIGVKYEEGDSIYEAYGIGGSVPFYTKSIDQIEVDTLVLQNFEIDVGILPKNHKGLLGLDILKSHNFTIDLMNLEIYQSTS